MRSRGHDLARFLEAVDQTARGEFAGVRWDYGTPREVISRLNQYGTESPTMAWMAAFVNVSVHLFADFFSARSLPLPLSSVIYDNCDREMRIFVHTLYDEGFNLRHVSLQSLRWFLARTGIEVWLWLQHGPRRETDAVKLKRYEMRAAVYGILSGINMAGCALFRNPFLIDLPILAATVDSAVRLLQTNRKRFDWRLIEKRNLDELLDTWSTLAAG